MSLKLGDQQDTIGLHGVDSSYNRMSQLRFWMCKPTIQLQPVPDDCGVWPPQAHCTREPRTASNELPSMRFDPYSSELLSHTDTMCSKQILEDEARGSLAG